MSSQYQTLTPAESSTTLAIDQSECFICRDVQLKASDPLRNFCDCKTLLAHHSCVSMWIQKSRGGDGSGARPQCLVCTSKYQLQRTSPWCSPWFWLYSWLALLPVLLLAAAVAYLLYFLLAVFTRPPPPALIQVAAVAFGVLMEIMLLKCLSSLLSRSYQQVELSSFTVRPRGCQGDIAATGSSCRDSVETPPPPPSRSCAISTTEEEEEKEGRKEARGWRSGRLCLL
ncbi:uncharacterized protein LOC142903084 [Nelusetta ayraudi]|uniref:uncharacterized protein LOC142903084 n=1 Tax=Nelusetta ayraudi TaxID=303726 RepID=UPI003F6ED4A1